MTERFKDRAGDKMNIINSLQQLMSTESSSASDDRDINDIMIIYMKQSTVIMSHM